MVIRKQRQKQAIGEVPLTHDHLSHLLAKTGQQRAFALNFFRNFFHVDRHG